VCGGGFSRRTRFIVLAFGDIRVPYRLRTSLVC
jgi:hypothetical protein